MISLESIIPIDKNDLPEVSKTLNKDDLPRLVEWLSLKDDDSRYRVFLLLQHRSRYLDDVYPYWDIFREKLTSDNSYQRSIGLVLLAENARWDMESRMEIIIDQYLDLLSDPKPITRRQCIQSLGVIVPSKPGLNKKIADRLLGYDLAVEKEAMQKLMLMDILKVLLAIRKENKSGKIDIYITEALLGEMLDRKSKKQIEALLSGPNSGEGM